MVPEPASLLLWAFVIAGLMGYTWRRQYKAARASGG
ncbi:MAG: PEP-CTERM sorting domain-containing protein [Gemmataceae bacterium]